MRHLTIRRPRHVVAIALAFALTIGLAACGSADGDGGGSDTTASTAPLLPVDYPAQWERVDAPADCMCADGSPWAYFIREADPTKVVFYLEGGGACFNAVTCSPGTATFKQVVGNDGGFAAKDGIFDLGNPANPLAGYSIVFVPYCTGDIHAGDVTKDYGNGVTVQHKGFVNGRTALEAMAERFPDAETLVVAGSSAGAFPTPVYAGLAAELLPDATIRVVADSGGAIPDAMSLVVSNWGTIDALPDWPQFAGISATDFTPALAFLTAAERVPGISFARLDYAFDRVLSGYAALAGLQPGNLVDTMKAGEARIEAGGTPVAAWISPGNGHTVLGTANLYTQSMNGESFIEWLTAFLRGEPRPDQYCTDCAG